jgi:hypothetical protein
MGLSLPIFQEPRQPVIGDRLDIDLDEQFGKGAVEVVRVGRGDQYPKDFESELVKLVVAAVEPR